MRSDLSTKVRRINKLSHIMLVVYRNAQRKSATKSQQNFQIKYLQNRQAKTKIIFCKMSQKSRQRLVISKLQDVTVSHSMYGIPNKPPLVICLYHIPLFLYCIANSIVISFELFWAYRRINSICIQKTTLKFQTPCWAF